MGLERRQQGGFNIRKKRVQVEASWFKRCMNSSFYLLWVSIKGVKWRNTFTFVCQETRSNPVSVTVTLRVTDLLQLTTQEPVLRFGIKSVRKMSRRRPEAKTKNASHIGHHTYIHTYVHTTYRQILVQLIYCASIFHVQTNTYTLDVAVVVVVKLNFFPLLQTFVAGFHSPIPVLI